MDDVATRIEHTVLGPTTTPADVQAVLDAAIETGMRACVPPYQVPMAAEYAPGVELSTVVGFPHGQHATASKAEEAAALAERGADELDVVANLGLLRAGEDETFRRDLAEVVAATTRPVKVIVEAPLLDEGEKHRAARLATEADAAYLKTATGFADGGATVADVELLSTYLPVKAAGGIDSWERAKAMFEAGAERIGASSGDAILDAYRRSKA
ncbi:deoxyribose-phosphate aldolase [Halapricum desulfuricans]|uniref:Deoxyribose-phosphate aldolase n=1 Tax=Halapricum desulfuricans TaxID=2841257 RepID=A0A897N224_9EURY|nr:deoxyribose-phosphate aldolase [Halapricum desulfuricans]QSG07002.1 Deoxyribose-phosphate aldolase [Halapricum desulfuricans]